MMCGLPLLVSTQCGCYLDLVQDNGYSFNPNNAEHLVSILQRYILGQEDISKQSTASLEIIKNFTPKLAGKRIEDAVELSENLS